jgi:hypothetical protein
MSSKKYGSNFLKGVSSFRVPLEETSKVFEKFLLALDCPRALTVWLMWKHNEHEQLANLKTIVCDYSDMVAFRDAYTATKFLSKYTDLSVEWDIKAVAMEKFNLFESLCRQTNSRFRNLSSDPLYSGSTVWLHNAVIRKINKVLGEFCLQEFFSLPDWGPGATTLIKRRHASPVNKFQSETGITRDLHALIASELPKEYVLWADQLQKSGFPTFQVGNKVVTVPKDATTDRVIAIEPGVNLWFQKSIGEMIRKRLLRDGIDLRYQERNQTLAKLGSLSNQLATVDMSSASDSISIAVVRELIPEPWLEILEASRSHYGVQSGVPIRWEKFSSMGNGFTFELETLIFYAVSYCCCEYLHIKPSDVSVYGDDIIFPSACFELFSRMMVFYGFQVNEKKSYVNSPFRESCGSHYYLGSDCKPVYHRDILSSVQSVYRLANAIRRLAHRRNSYGCDASFRPAFDHLVQIVPKGLRLRIPHSLGDGGFISNFDESTPNRSRRASQLSERGFEGFLVRHLVEVSKTYQDDRDGYLLASLWAMLERDPEAPKPLSLEGRARLKAVVDLVPPEKSMERNSVPLSGRVKIKLTSSLVSQWNDLGPWI